MLDLKRHDSVIRRLCRAFYDHISKHAYLEMLNYPNIDSMSEAKNIWEIRVKRWWPADYGDGEPDMPHDTIFNRELPLYVDYSDYDRHWLAPTDRDQDTYFMDKWGGTPISRTNNLIETWKQMEAIGICSPKVLSIMNTVFENHYLRENTKLSSLYSLYEKVAESVSSETNISEELFMASPLVRWPLYRFV